MFRVVPVLLLAGACFAAQPSEQEVKKELERFQGKWEAIASQSFDGTVPTDIELQLMSLDVEDDMFTMQTGSLTVKGKFAVDPTQKVKTIDIFFSGNKVNPMRGVYEIVGDTRKSSFAMPGKDRPDKVGKAKGGFCTSNGSRSSDLPRRPTTRHLRCAVPWRKFTVWFTPWFVVVFPCQPDFRQTACFGRWDFASCFAGSIAASSFDSTSFAASSWLVGSDSGLACWSLG